jgi:hypothetical protein
LLRRAWGREPVFFRAISGELSIRRRLIFELCFEFRINFLRRNSLVVTGGCKRPDIKMAVLSDKVGAVIDHFDASGDFSKSLICETKSIC